MLQLPSFFDGFLLAECAALGCMCIYLALLMIIVAIARRREEEEKATAERVDLWVRGKQRHEEPAY